MFAPAQDRPRPPHVIGVTSPTCLLARTVPLTPVRYPVHATVFVWMITATLLWASARLVAWLHRWPVPDPSSFPTVFLPWTLGLMAPEPAERTLYVLLVLLAPGFVCLAWWMVRRTTPIQRAVSGKASASVVLSFAMLAMLGAALCWVCVTAESRPVFALAGGRFPILAWGASCLLFAPTIFRFTPGVWKHGHTVRLRWASRVGVWLAGLLLVGWTSVVARVFDVHTVPQVNWVHFNTVLYPSAQVAAGQRMLVDFLPQYGCYAEFLKPWFSLVGFSVWTFTATMAGLNFVAASVLLLVWARVLRSTILLGLGTLILVWIVPTWYQAVGTLDPYHRLDPYYQYFPIRFVFPAFSVLGAYAYLRSATFRRAGLLTVFCALGVWWNADSGVVTLVAWLTLLACKEIAEPRGVFPWLRGLKVLGLNVSLGALTFGAFYLLLCIEADRWVDLAGMIRYQQIFYGSGFCMLPMPTGPHFWWVVVGVYLLGLVVGLSRLGGGRLEVGHGMILHLSVLGLGLFSYYQGRSHDICLLLVCWPAIMVAFLVADRILAAVREGLLPAVYGLTAAPVLLLGVMGGACLLETRTRLTELYAQARQARTERIPTPFTDNLAFVRRSLAAETHADLGCLFISPFQASFHAELGVPSALGGPSICEYLLWSDLDSMLAGLRTDRVSHLFLEAYPFAEVGGPFLRDRLRPILSRYRTVGRSPTGNLLHLVPRPGTGDEPALAFRREFTECSRLLDDASDARHAVRFPDSGVLLDSTGTCRDFPFDWGAFTPASDFAVEIVFTPDAVQPPLACLLSNHPGRGGEGFTVQRTVAGGPNEFQCHFGRGAAGFVASKPFLLTPGREHYLAISVANEVASVYLDGRLAEVLPLGGPMAVSRTPLTVGNWAANDRRFQGDIAELELHDCVLSADTVAANARRLAMTPDR